MKIKTHDKVMILQGKDRGKTGKVLRAYPDMNKVLVEKLNMAKKHLKPTRSAPHGGIQETERPLPIERVMLLCPHCSKPTRIGITISKDGKRLRTCKQCKAAIDS